jgi:lipopolysaccharide/colanic/teichoic acid biosynthesis glycosyltransferase
MSLVGPRPERSYHSELLSTEIPHYNARYASKPGLTGWAQVHGLRGDTSLMERVRYDQLMNLGWKGMIPIALLNLFVTAALILLLEGRV